MQSSPIRSEIDHHTIKLIVGLIALSLAALTSLFSNEPLQSISAAYHQGGWARNILVGFLFAIAAFLLAYNGRSTREMVLSKVAAVAALGVAMFPCRCEGHKEIVRGVHGASAAVMFVILAVFCYLFLRRARAKGHPRAQARATIYALCGVTILVAIAVIALDELLDGALGSRIDRLTFYGEAAALTAFGIAWLVASCTLPLVTGPEERVPLSPFSAGRAPVTE